MHCLTNQDITHQFAYTQEIRKEFFDDANNNDLIELNGKKSQEKLNAAVLTATDCRLNNNFKFLLSKEGNFSVGDIVIFYKTGFRKYKIELVKQTDAKYPIYKQLFTDERHLPLYINDIDKNDFSPLNYTPFSAKDKIKSYNRIIFGAPGTGKSFRLNKEARESNFAEITRVTFHPDYSYSQFVGTYKPVMVKSESKVTDENIRQIIEILQDKTKTAQEKYDLLYDKFKDNNLTTLPFLLGLYTDDNFTTLKKDGSATADDNSAERNHGKAIRPYINLKSQYDNETISYKYVPGPFLRTLVAALKSGKSGNPQNYLLIIEEINRARVAAVFGDVFQLLDRNANGESEYEIQTSEDMRNYLAEQLGGNPYNYKALKLPNNFYIWATMNSADQGVFPMDTAFKRRWNFEYIGIDEEVTNYNSDSVEEKEQKEKMRNYQIPVKSEKGIFLKWDLLRCAINKRLLSVCGVNEDKLLGPYFISENDLKTAIEKRADFINLFKSKVLMYLYEDAAKIRVKNFFAGVSEDEMTYSKVCDEFEKKGILIFGDDFKKKFDSSSQNGEEKIVGSGPTMTENTKIDSPASSQNGGTN